MNDLQDTYGPVLVLIVIGLIFLVYFIPSIISLVRNHHQKLPIVLINFFFGWTFVGWVGSFIWSLTSPSKVVVINQHPTEAKVDVSGELSKLHELKEKEVITEDEFLSRKDKLLKS